VDGSEAVHPYLSNVDDPYIASQDDLLQAKWTKDNKILAGDFKPSMANKCLEKVNR